MTDIDPPDDDVDREFLRSLDCLVAHLREKRFVEAEEFLRSEIAAQQDPMARLDHMRNLAMVLTLSGQDAESLAVMRERVRLAPDEPIVWCGLAWHLHIHKGAGSAAGPLNEKEVLETIDHAVTVAERIGGIELRHCLTDRARIAGAIERWDVVEDSIRRILAIPDGRGVPDTAIAVDFLRGLPPGAVDPELIRHLQEKHAAASARRDIRQDP